MEYAEKVLELAPESTAGYVTRGYIYVDDESYKLARSDFEQALTLAPNSLNAVNGLASLHWAQEEYDGALSYYDQILTELPDSATARVRQAWIYYEQGKSEEAWEIVHEALAQDPDHPEGLRLRALLNMDNGNLDRAQLDLHRALDLFPKHAWAHLAQAWAYSYQGRPEEARRSAERALELDSRLTDAYLVQMSVAWSEDDFEEVERVARTWVEAEPDSAEANYWLGDAYLDTGKSQEALDSFNTTFELLEEDDLLTADALFERALAYFGLSEAELAEADLEAALTLATNLDFIDEIEVVLVNPGAQAERTGGRLVIEDLDGGYTISFDEKWEQWPAEPSEGYVLSLIYSEDLVLASADVYIIPWDASLSIYDLGAILDPASEGATTQPLETIQIAGESGLLRVYEIENFGEIIIGRQYMVTLGDRAAIVILEAVVGTYGEFEEEFEALVASFNFLP